MSAPMGSASGVLAAVAASLAMVGCAASAPSPPSSVGGWDGEVRRWGTLREVLREGRDEGRIAVGAALEAPHACQGKNR